MSEHPDPVQAAIDRGNAMSSVLIEARDALFEPMTRLVVITGEEGLRACVAGVAEAVIEAKRRGWGSAAVVEGAGS